MKSVLKDRKKLLLIFGIVLVFVFSLTIAYAALSAVLTISGNAEVVASSWNIYLANPRVTNGSATTDLPIIKSNSTLEFKTTLNMPGDFYEFTVDVVNDGDLDAMIENVVKNPELDSNQKKYLNYTVTYQNGEIINVNQLLSKNTTMPIKVRIEYRNDISASDLPSTSTNLNLSLTLEYIQSDGTGSTVNNNGVGGEVTGEDPYSIEAYGSLDDIGTIVKIGTEKFYTIGTDGDNVKLLAMYNLHIGNVASDCLGSFGENCTVTVWENATGKQSSMAIGFVPDGTYYYGVTAFGNKNGYSGSYVETYTDDYKDIIEEYGVSVVEARGITFNELSDENTFACEWFELCSDKYPWIYSTSYWTESQERQGMYYISSDGYMDYAVPSYANICGVRPVIVVSKDTFQ